MAIVYITSDLSWQNTGNSHLNWEVFVTPDIPVVTDDFARERQTAMAANLLNSHHRRA